MTEAYSMSSNDLVDQSHHIISVCGDGHIHIIKNLCQGLSMQMGTFSRDHTEIWNRVFS